jgi:hypothetical protein
VPGYVSAIRRYYIDRLSSGAPLREKALAIRADTCGPATTFLGAQRRAHAIGLMACFI